MLSRNRKWLLVLGLLALTALLAGCGSAQHQMTTDAMRNGSPWQRYVVYWFSYTLDTFAHWFGNSYGLAILLLVVIVRTIILPLTLKQYKSSKAMQALQPELKKIKDKHKDNPQKQQEETMKLFQANQVNPLAGCLPLLIQMPIFFALYGSINANIAIREHSFLGMQLGLSPSQSGHWYYYIIPVIAAITTFVQSKMMPQQPNNPMQAILLIFPVMIFVMAINFAIALPVYWIFTNLYTIVQNYFLYVRSSDKGKEAPAK